MCSTNLRVASPRAFFAESFVPLGVVPGDGVALLLTKAIGPMRAAEMALLSAAPWALAHHTEVHREALTAFAGKRAGKYQGR